MTKSWKCELEERSMSTSCAKVHANMWCMWGVHDMWNDNCTRWCAIKVYNCKCAMWMGMCNCMCESDGVHFLAS